MRCSVTGCKNDSRYSSKSQGITFHIFPVEPSLRSAWLQAIGKASWVPKERSAVCSEHFLCEDLYETKKGMRRKVRPGAVPVVTQEHENPLRETGTGVKGGLKVCRMCLVVDSKLYPMRKYKLVKAYELLTGLSICSEDQLPCRVCARCGWRLLRHARFRESTLRAHQVLVDVLRGCDTITEKDLDTISLQNNQLESSLAPKHFPPDHYDLLIFEDDINTANANAKSTVKNEDTNNKIFLNEFDDDDSDGIANDVEFTITDKETFIEESKPKIKNEDETEPFLNDLDDPKEEAEGEAKSDREDDDFKPTDSSTDEELPRSVLRSRLQESRIKKEKKVQKRTKKVKKGEKKDEQPKVDRRRKPFFTDDLSETLFAITDLTVEEQVAEIENRKDSSNYKNGVFKCEECYKGFLDEDAYNSHMSRHTNECGEYRCHICKTHFKHPHALRKHVTAHHTQRFSCKQCVYSTTHRQSARLHERWHKGTKYTCPHCPDEFVKFTTYMGHIRIKHPSDFVCQLCGYSFVSEKGIQLHKRLKHRQDMQVPEDGPFCELCNLRFYDTIALKRHVSVSARHSTRDPDSRAPNKPKGRGRDMRLREKAKDDDDRPFPSQRRAAEGPISCEQCGVQLEDSRAYHGHFRRMHPDKNRTKYPSMKSPCMCEVCGRLFQSYALLKDHRWVHTGERPFSCDSCGKSFRMKQRLVAHRRVHSEEKATYGCGLCGKQFSTHSNRQRHMFIHTGLKPFKCEMCGKGFKHMSEKRAHISYVHLKKPWPKRSRGKRRGDPRQGSMESGVPLPGDLGPPPLWPACDPKLQHTHDKPPYYALKM